ncbi:MAG: carboxylesterase family protein [Chitinophagales bacterium]
MRFILSCFLIINTILLVAQPVCNSENRYIDSVFSQVDITTNIWFGNANPFNPFSSNQDLYLDFYEPHGDTASARPLIIHAFGGGFLSGNRTSDDIPYWADQYVKKGYVFVSIDYRLGYNPTSASSVERAAYRCAQDYNAALRFLADNASTYRIDLNNVIVTGNSAGSIGALIVAFMDDNDRPGFTYLHHFRGKRFGLF